MCFLIFCKNTKYPRFYCVTARESFPLVNAFLIYFRGVSRFDQSKPLTPRKIVVSFWLAMSRVIPAK